MTDKVQKIRKEVERIQLYTQSEVLKQVLEYIDKVQEEPVSNPTPNERMNKERFAEACRAACCDRNYRSHYGHTETRDDYFVDGVQWADEHPKEEPVSEKKCMFTKDSYTDEDRKVLCEDCKEKCEYNKKEEPVSEELEEAANNALNNVLNAHEIVNVRSCLEMFRLGTNWQKEKEYTCYEEAFEDGAKWKVGNLWKTADGDDLPEIDREVIALLDGGKVVFAHRPPEYWDGKDITTGKVTRNYPKTYDKGGWNISNVKWWLDCSLPKEIEL